MRIEQEHVKIASMLLVNLNGLSKEWHIPTAVKRGSWRLSQVSSFTQVDGVNLIVSEVVTQRQVAGYADGY